MTDANSNTEDKDDEIQSEDGNENELEIASISIGNDNFESRIKSYLTESGITDDIESIFNVFKTKENVLIDMAKAGEREDIKAFMQEKNIGSPFQRGEVTTLMIKDYQQPTPATEQGKFVFIFFFSLVFVLPHEFS